MSGNILIIDDDASFKKILELRLKAFISPIQITSFDRLEKARAHFNQNPTMDFDLVILDEHLPDGRGIELLQEGWFENLAVLSVSSDNAPEMPGASLRAGATYFLDKSHTTQALFEPLIRGIIERNRLQKKLTRLEVDNAIMTTVKTLVSTLKHEINNPLGAVLGAAYLLRNNPAANEEQKQAAELVESSGIRIKHVLDQLCKAIAVESVQKANQQVFHIPGDKPWDSSESDKDK